MSIDQETKGAEDIGSQLPNPRTAWAAGDVTLTKRAALPKPAVPSPDDAFFDERERVEARSKEGKHLAIFVKESE